MEQERSRVTIYDVAQHAGVAISTVSRVMNNSPHVSPATRERVKESIDSLRFRPDRVAKALAQQHTQTIAIAIPTFTTPFHNELLAGVRSVLADVDCDLLLFDLGTNSPLDRLMQKLKAGTVDGIVAGWRSRVSSSRQGAEGVTGPHYFGRTPPYRFRLFLLG